MEKNQYLCRLQEEFEQTAYGYGVNPTTCVLLGEYLLEKLSLAWSSGQFYEKTKYVKHTSKITPLFSPI